MDYSTLISAVDFSTVGTGLLAVGVAIGTIYIGRKGLRMLLAFLK